MYVASLAAGLGSARDDARISFQMEEYCAKLYNEPSPHWHSVAPEGRQEIPPPQSIARGVIGAFTQGPRPPLKLETTVRGARRQSIIRS